MKRAALVAGLCLVGVSALGGNGETVQVIRDPGYEASGLVRAFAVCTVIKPVSCTKVSSQFVMQVSAQFQPYQGDMYVTLGGQGVAQTSYLVEQVSVPAGETAVLRFYLRVVTRERSRNPVDVLDVEVRSESGTLLKTLASFSNLDASPDYVEHVFDLSRYAGQTIGITFTATEDRSLPTWFLLDEVTLTVSD